MQKTKPPVIEQLKTISGMLSDLELYHTDIDDITNAIVYSKINDQIQEQIWFIETGGK